LGRPPDPSISWDFEEFANSAGRYVGVKVQNYRPPGERPRRNNRIRGFVGTREANRVTLAMREHDYVVTKGNFVNFKQVELLIEPGDFVVRPEDPGWRGVVASVEGRHATCVTMVDGVERSEAHRLDELALAEEVSVWG
jgi:hypothetical protein